MLFEKIISEIFQFHIFFTSFKSPRDIVSQNLRFSYKCKIWLLPTLFVENTRVFTTRRNSKCKKNTFFLKTSSFSPYFIVVHWEAEKVHLRKHKLISWYIRFSMYQFFHVFFSDFFLQYISYFLTSIGRQLLAYIRQKVNMSIPSMELLVNMQSVK